MVQNYLLQLIAVLLNDAIICIGREVICSTLMLSDKVAEWLRRWTANPFPSGSVGSNPILVDSFYLLYRTLTSVTCAYKDKNWMTYCSPYQLFSSFKINLQFW